MIHSNFFEDKSDRRAYSRFNPFVYTIGNPEDRGAVKNPNPSSPSSPAGVDPESANWLGEMLTACYND